MNAHLQTIIPRNALHVETFVSPMVQPDPGQARFTVQLDPGGSGGDNALIHLHPLADETFCVVAGQLEPVIAGQHHMLYPGQSPTIPHGRPHYFFNAANGVTAASVRFSTAQNHEGFFMVFPTLAERHPEWVSAIGDAKLLLIALFLKRYRDHLYISGTPVCLQRPLFRLLAQWRGCPLPPQPQVTEKS
jgi:mannose-6-phosphate isomerase-like protein (cupin superfamily)